MGGYLPGVGAMMSSDRRMLIGAGKGLVAGAVGVAVMTLGEKVEQVFTHRPNSFVPAHTLERLLGLLFKPDDLRSAADRAPGTHPGLKTQVRGLQAVLRAGES
jgi:hypothetical protein